MHRYCGIDAWGPEKFKNLVSGLGRVVFLHGFPENGGGIFKLLRSPGIDSKESIPPAYVAWPVVTTTLFLISS